MTATAFALMARVAGLLGVKLSPFVAGAIVAAVAAGAFGLYSLKLYNAGFATAESQCETDALRSEIAAMKKDRDDARVAAADAALKAAAIKSKAEADAKGTADYVAELEKRPAPSCILTCDDLRGMRIKSAACPAGARPPTAPGRSDATRPRS